MKMSGSMCTSPTKYKARENRQFFTQPHLHYSRSLLFWTPAILETLLCWNETCFPLLMLLSYLYYYWFFQTSVILNYVWFPFAHTRWQGSTIPCNENNFWINWELTTITATEYQSTETRPKQRVLLFYWVLVEVKFISNPKDKE